jgi:hypothetical protein
VTKALAVASAAIAGDMVIAVASEASTLIAINRRRHIMTANSWPTSAGWAAGGNVDAAVASSKPAEQQGAHELPDIASRQERHAQRRFVAGSGRRPPHQNPNASRTLACQLSPAADKPPHGLYSAMCHERPPAVHKNSEPFRGRSTVKSVTDPAIVACYRS